MWSEVLVSRHVASGEAISDCVDVWTCGPHPTPATAMCTVHPLRIAVLVSCGLRHPPFFCWSPLARLAGPPPRKARSNARTLAGRRPTPMPSVRPRECGI
eukprot:scaffold5126_cov125-Isochrysis_galbana.AAC.9